MDPSPLENKDLNDDVEEFIVSWSQEYRVDQALTLRIYLKEWPAEDPTDAVRNSIHNYFAYRANLNRLAFRRLMRRGRTSLLGTHSVIHTILPSRSHVSRHLREVTESAERR